VPEIAATSAEAKCSARHMKNCIGVFGLSLQELDRFDGGQNKQFDFVTLGFAL
jgi:hypothetical protein